MKHIFVVAIIFASLSLDASRAVDELFRKHKQVMRLLVAQQNAYARAVCSTLYVDEAVQGKSYDCYLRHSLKCVDPLLLERITDLDTAFDKTQKWFDKNPEIVIPLYDQEKELRKYRKLRHELVTELK